MYIFPRIAARIAVRMRFKKNVESGIGTLVEDKNF
jgi:hypothetical protein